MSFVCGQASQFQLGNVETCRPLQGSIHGVSSPTWSGVWEGAQLYANLLEMGLEEESSALLGRMPSELHVKDKLMLEWSQRASVPSGPWTMLQSAGGTMSRSVHPCSKFKDGFWELQ